MLIFNGCKLILFFLHPNLVPFLYHLLYLLEGTITLLLLLNLLLIGGLKWILEACIFLFGRSVDAFFEG